MCIWNLTKCRAASSPSWSLNFGKYDCHSIWRRGFGKPGALFIGAYITDCESILRQWSHQWNFDFWILLIVESSCEWYTSFMYLTYVHLQKLDLVFSISPKKGSTFIPWRLCQNVITQNFFGLYQRNPKVTTTTTIYLLWYDVHICR